MKHWHRCERWTRYGVACPVTVSRDEEEDVEEDDDGIPIPVPVGVPVAPPPLMLPAKAQRRRDAGLDEIMKEVEEELADERGQPERVAAQRPVKEEDFLRQVKASRSDVLKEAINKVAVDRPVKEEDFLHDVLDNTTPRQRQQKAEEAVSDQIFQDPRVFGPVPRKAAKTRPVMEPRFPRPRAARGRTAPRSQDPEVRKARRFQRPPPKPQGRGKGGFFFNAAQRMREMFGIGATRRMRGPLDIGRRL